MLPSIDLLRQRLRVCIDNKGEQGHVVDGLQQQLDELPDSYDALVRFSSMLVDLPVQADWPYYEPSDWEGIGDESAFDRPHEPLASVEYDAMAPRIAAAFAGSVCGCMLGKPIEVNPTYDELCDAARRSGTSWPFEDYIDERLLDALGRRHASWVTSTMPHMKAVAPDDDVNYTLIGMLTLERHGYAFSQEDLADLWFRYLPMRYCYGPERTQLIKTAYASLLPKNAFSVSGWADRDNPEDEMCGALIRVDAYGYACPGDPARAVSLAWRDASWTHRRTGIYGALFVAAAIATAFVVDGPLDLFRIALRYVPQRSRFYERTADCLDIVAQADDWQAAYRAINDRYGVYQHGSIYQEVGTLINSIRFADNVGHGIALQVAQGNDTDSFGATAGSILGALHGMSGIDARWLEPFQGRIELGMAGIGELSLSGLMQRMGQLPEKCAKLLDKPASTDVEGRKLHPDTGLPIALPFD